MSLTVTHIFVRLMLSVFNLQDDTNHSDKSSRKATMELSLNPWFRSRHVGPILDGVCQRVGGERIQGRDGTEDDCRRRRIPHRESPQLATGHSGTEDSNLKLPRLRDHRLAAVGRSHMIDFRSHMTEHD